MATKEEAIKTINESTSVDFVVRTPEQEQQFLADFKEAEVEKAIKPQIGKLHSMYEADFEGVTGQKKPEGVKGYNWIKEEAKKLKESADKVKDYEAKLTTLEEQLKTGKMDEVAKVKIDELTSEVKRLEGLHKKAKDEWNAGLERERGEFRSTRIKAELNHALLGFKFLDRAIIADDVRDTYINKTISELAQIADFDESGKLIFRDAEKMVMRNKDNAVVTPSELLEAKLSSILDKGKQQPGLGARDNGKGRSDEAQTDVVVPTTVNTKTKLTAFLRQNYPDMLPQSPEYKAAYTKYGKDLPIQ